MKILDAGIDVLTSMNVQHVESLNDQVWQVTGIRVRETVPDWVVQEADEVVMVDVTPRALLHRLARGVVYSPDKAQRAMEHFFTESNLTALRELALRQAAHQLDERIEAETPATGRILLWLTPHPSTAMLIRRGRRVADFLGYPCTAVYAERDAEAMEPWLNICVNLRIDAKAIACSGNRAKAVATYARSNAVTQVYVTRDAPDVNKLANLARDMQITIVAERVRTA
jgi:two-component system sensor histidine kinase KdpD